MKKLCLVFCLLLLAGCEVGKFTPEREKLHNMGKENICEKSPERCVNDVPW